MSVFEIIRFAIRGLFINKLRTALTTLGIMIGVASVIILLAVGNGSSKAIQDSLSRLGTNSLQVRSGGQGFGFRARASANVTKPLTILDTTALADRRKHQILSKSRLSPQLMQLAWLVIIQRRLQHFMGHGLRIMKLVIQRFNQDRISQMMMLLKLDEFAMIGQTTATALFGTENPIGQTMRCSGIQFTVIGLTAVKGSSGFQDGDSLVLIPITTMENTITGNHL
ncbi:MAG: ABC transporter permease [Actinomycetota bacterium]